MLRALLIFAPHATSGLLLTTALRSPALMALRQPVRAASSMSAELPTLTNLEDPRVWLEDVEGEKQLDWVKERNNDAVGRIGEPSESSLYNRLLDIMESDEKIPYIGRVLNGLFYNFWQDEQHVQGIWRRCTLDEYRKPDPQWELVLDLDALSAADGVSWVWSGSTLLNEGPAVRKDRCMISLSRGGADAKISREFDLDTKAFISPSEGGFELPEAKTSLSYKDRDTLLVGGAFGDQEMTDSGYPRTVYEWKRGTPLDSAVRVYEGEQTDVSVGGAAYLDRGAKYELRYRSITFYTARYELKITTHDEGSPFEYVAVPDDANIGTFADQLLITLRSPWLGHPAGSLLAANAAGFLSAGDDDARSALLTPLFTPTDSCSLEGSAETKSYLVLSCLDNVVTECRFWKYADGAFTLERSLKGEVGVSPSYSAVEPEGSDQLWVTSDGYTQPTTLALADATTPEATESLKALPAFYDASGLETQQLWATSADGTKVPYFLTCPAELPLDGSTPTILYGYGGFEISLTPGYSAGVGAAWLEKGFAYVQANIRGGGEFGPRWHQAALKEKRNKAYEDFEAVAKDLIARGVTSPAKLGCQGGSNGGLLTGNMLARPTAGSELFGAIVCQVPLLDMKRFHTLLAGASWMGEYGNPDTADWDFLQAYSPYHNVDATATYPPILVTTSTRDDRVHPGHARKLVSKLMDLGKADGTFYYENIEGGHGGAANNKQRAFMSTLAYDFLEQRLTGGGSA